MHGATQRLLGIITGNQGAMNYDSFVAGDVAKDIVACGMMNTDI